MTKKLSILFAACVMAALLAVPASADARYKTRIGIGDQHSYIFGQPAYQALKIKRVRYFIPWNAMDSTSKRQAAEDYVKYARATGASVLLHISTHDLREKKAKLPSTSQYSRKVGRLVRHFRKLGVREFGVWNEANHKSQPTWRSPKRAAQYYKVMRKLCRGCTIVALDVLDQAGVERYMSRFYRALGSYHRRRATLVGIHNYSDVNRRRTSGTRSIMRTAKRYNRRSTFWLTETGGLVKFGRSFPYSTTRAAKRLGYLFTITKRYRRQIKRVYVYNYSGAPRGARFDAGVTSANGTPRRAYGVLRKHLRRFSR